MRHPHTDTWVTPCRTCGGTDFDLTTHPDMPHGLVRYCVPCHLARKKRHRQKNREEYREYDRAYRKKIATQKCAFDGCDRPRKSRYCMGHAKQLQRYGKGKMRPLKSHGGRRKVEMVS